MTDDAARALLGLPVYVDDLRLGTVGAAWIDGTGVVLGLEVTSAWTTATSYVPFPAASIEGGAVRTSSLAILGVGPIVFFAEQGAQRIAEEGLGLEAVHGG